MKYLGIFLTGIAIVIILLLGSLAIAHLAGCASAQKSEAITDNDVQESYYDWMQNMGWERALNSVDVGEVDINDMIFKKHKSGICFAFYPPYKNVLRIPAWVCDLK